MLKTKIKANAVNNLTDARYFAAWEVEWLGFNLDFESSEMSLEKIAAIQEWVDGVTIIGETNHPELDQVEQYISHLGLKALQVGMFTPVEVLNHLKSKVDLIQEIIIESESQITNLLSTIQDRSDYVDYFNLDFSKNQLSWSAISQQSKVDLSKMTNKYPILLSLDLTASEVEEVLDHIQPIGLGVRGGAEEKVGYKSFDDLDEVFEVLEILV